MVLPCLCWWFYYYLLFWICYIERLTVLEDKLFLLSLHEASGINKDAAIIDRSHLLFTKFPFIFSLFLSNSFFVEGYLFINSLFTLYVAKQKCTIANVVIYAVISFFYSQKFFCWLNFALLLLVGLSKTHAQHIMESIAYNLYRTLGIIVSNSIR